MRGEGERKRKRGKDKLARLLLYVLKNKDKKLIIIVNSSEAIRLPS